MACKCGKNKNCKCSELLYITNPNCGWCKKADPVVEEMVKKGHKITTLDLTNPEDAQRANEVKAKHGAQCGTPLFIDGKSGNMVCGFRQDVLQDWAEGKDIPAPPPRPQQPQQRPGQPQQPQQQMGPQMTKFEYIWTDGSSSIRSKTKYMVIDRSKIKSPSDFISNIPEWSFDGSSTNQAKTENSDCILKPVKIVPNTTSMNRFPSFIVLCEVLDSDGNAHETNTRSKLLDRVKETELDDMWFSVEQEFTMMNPFNNKPIGWEEYSNDTPPPQGDYYCGVGFGSVEGRELIEQHALACIGSGITIAGTNAEVMLSQWEYQTEPKPAIEAADDLIISRFLLQRIGERMNVAISYDPKPVDGDWNGAGAHINFSTNHMRENADMDYMNLICSSMGAYHEKAIEVYGKGNERRLTGKHETSSIDKFTWGELDRTASIRIPLHTVQNEGKGYLEDRRPAANVDPYEAFSYLMGVTSNISEEMFIAT